MRKEIPQLLVRAALLAAAITGVIMFLIWLGAYEEVPTWLRYVCGIYLISTIVVFAAAQQERER